MNLSLKLGPLALSFAANRSTDSTISQRAAPLTPAQAWLRGDDSCVTHNLLSPYQQNVWVYTAVSALAQTVSSIPFRISRGDRSGENILTHGPIVDLFNRPHPYLDRFRFWEFIVTWYCLRGETFLVALDRSQNILPIHSPRLRVSVSPPSSLLVLNPDQLQHLVENLDLLGWRFTGSRLGGPLPSMDLLPEEVIHDFLPNPYLFWRGLSPLSVALLAAQTDYASAQFMKGLMFNNADTGVIVRTSQQLSDEQRESLKATLQNR